MASERVFVDSDVIISSLLSISGAAYLIISSNTKDLKFFISNISQRELKIVTRKLGIKKQKLESLIKKRFKTVNLKGSLKELKTKYKHYTTDSNDVHVIAGAVKAKVKFLLTYNQKYFKRDKVKKEFDILILTPASFLQYLRSRD